MAVSLQEILDVQLVLDVFSKTRAGGGPVGRWLGFQMDRVNPENVSIGGKNTKQGDIRSFLLRISNNPRTVMQIRAPSTGPASVPTNPMGQTTVTCARFHEKIQLDCEQLGNLSPIIGPNSVIDTGGQSYIALQEKAMAMRGNSTIEAVSAGMIRGQFYVKTVSGDRSYVVLTQPTSGNYYTVSSNLPAGNTGFLNMLGTGNLITASLDNPNAPFITMLAGIKQAYARLTGFVMTDIWLDGPEWTKVTTNNQVRQTAGTSETPFAEFSRVMDNSGYDRMPPGENDYYGMLKGDPTVRFHMSDFSITTGGDVDPINTGSNAISLASYDPVIPSNTMIFSATPDMSWTFMYMGAEYIIENYGQNMNLKRGWATWHEMRTQPSAIEILSLLNIIPVLENPYLIAVGKTSAF